MSSIRSRPIAPMGRFLILGIERSGPTGPFFIPAGTKGDLVKPSNSLMQLLEPTVVGLGFELVGVEFDGHQRVLRIYIDHPDGITLENCSKVSYQLSGLLDVEDPIPGRYQLEISSPGMDRPLFTLEHFDRFMGSMVRIQLTSPIEGRRRFKARIEAIEGNELVLVDDEARHRIPFDLIEKARLSPEFDK